MRMYFCVFFFVRCVSFILLLFGFVQFVEAKIKQDFQVCIKHKHEQQQHTINLVLRIMLIVKATLFCPLFFVSVNVCVCVCGSVIAFIAEEVKIKTNCDPFICNVSFRNIFQITKIMGY